MHMNWLDDSQIEELVNFDAFEDQELFEVLDDDEKAFNKYLNSNYDYWFSLHTNKWLKLLMSCLTWLNFCLLYTSDAADE